MAILLLGRTAVRRPLSQLLPRKPQLIRKTHNSTRANPTTPPQASQNAANQGTSIPVPNTVAALPLWQRLGPLSRFFELYGRSQRSRPYLTQFVSSVVIYFLGDMSAQSLSGEKYDPNRTFRALVIGAGSSIPSYRWFIFLGQHFNYTSKLLSLATKVAVNQLIFTPLFNTYFFGTQSLLSSLQTSSTVNLSQTWEHIKRTVPISFVNSCKLWPAVTAFSFTFVSPQHRSIFAGGVAIGWQTYLSYLNTQAERFESGTSDVKGKLIEQVDENDLEEQKAKTRRDVESVEVRAVSE